MAADTATNTHVDAPQPMQISFNYLTDLLSLATRKFIDQLGVIAVQAPTEYGGASLHYSVVYTISRQKYAILPPSFRTNPSYIYSPNGSALTWKNSFEECILAVSASQRALLSQTWSANKDHILAQIQDQDAWAERTLELRHMHYPLPSAS